jgi:mannose-6-phosphate isomerase-like protein (cupin superfamily)
MPNPTFRLAETVVHLGAQRISVDRNDDAYWAARDRPELRTGSVISVFAYTKTWNYQERHPSADELAVVLTGRARVLLDDGRGDRSTELAPGAGCVVPAGTWHRLAVDEPCTVLFVTPVPVRTEHRDVDGGERSCTRCGDEVTIAAEP